LLSMAPLTNSLRLKWQKYTIFTKYELESSLFNYFLVL